MQFSGRVPRGRLMSTWRAPATIARSHTSAGDKLAKVAGGRARTHTNRHSRHRRPRSKEWNLTLVSAGRSSRHPLRHAPIYGRPLLRATRSKRATLGRAKGAKSSPDRGEAGNKRPSSPWPAPYQWDGARRCRCRFQKAGALTQSAHLHSELSAPVARANDQQPDRNR